MRTINQQDLEELWTRITQRWEEQDGHDDMSRGIRAGYHAIMCDFEDWCDDLGCAAVYTGGVAA